MGRKMIKELGNKLHYKKSIPYEWKKRYWL
jgi:hypothetical protein